MRPRAMRPEARPLRTRLLVMRETEHVHFVELAGPEARTLLERQVERWRRAGVATTLLRSDDRDDLWLLVGSSPEPPPPATVAGARRWRFRRAPPTDAAPAAGEAPGTTGTPEEDGAQRRPGSDAG
jgi:hypothetical protein